MTLDLGQTVTCITFLCCIHLNVHIIATFICIPGMKYVYMTYASSWVPLI